jgi:hypothetical protein
MEVYMSDNYALMIDPAKGSQYGNSQVVSAKAHRVIEYLRAQGITREQCVCMAGLLESETGDPPQATRSSEDREMLKSIAEHVTLPRSSD